MNQVKFWYPEFSNIGEEASIGFGSVIHSHVWIGNRVTIGEDCKIQAFAFLPDGLTLEDNVFIGPGVIFTNDPAMNIVPSEQFTPTVTLVKRGARIGAGAMIRAGVIIGAEAVIGMGAVVLTDIPDGEVWVGNPARKLR